MFFSEEELILILKKNLPHAPAKDLESVAKSILNEGKHWEEVDLHQQFHDQTEMELLHGICQRHAKDKRPKNIRLFYKD